MDYFSKVNTAEMMRLANMLGCANIPYDMGESFSGLHICYPNAENVVCSVIQHSFSYGGRDGKLEIMGLLTDEEEEYDSVVGWLSAENVFERISKHFQNNT